MNKYRNNFYVVLGLLMTVHNMVSGIFVAMYGKGDAKIALYAALTAASIGITVWELRKPRNK